MDSRMYSMPRLAVFHPCPFLLNQNFLYVNAVGSSMKFPFYQCVFSGTRFSCLLWFFVFTSCILFNFAFRLCFRRDLCWFCLELSDSKLHPCCLLA